MPEFTSGYSGGGVVRGHGAGTATTVGTTLTANAAANTLGTAVELAASTEFDANWILVHAGEFSAAANYLVNIMIGAATEQVIIPNLMYVPRKAGQGYSPYKFPVLIPAGSRISANAQSSTGDATMEIQVTLISGTALSGGTGPSYVSAYGATASSTGTNHDPGAVTNTKGTWTEIAASTDRNHQWLVVAVSVGDAATGVHNYLFDIGIGAATETVLIDNVLLTSDGTSDQGIPHVWEFPIFVPAGSRLTYRMQSNTGTDGDRDAFVKLYGC